MSRLRTVLGAPTVLGVLLAVATARAQDLPPLPPPPPPPPAPPAPYAQPAPPPRPAPGRSPPPAPAMQGGVEVRFEPDAAGLQVYEVGGVTPVERIVPGYWGWWYERGYAPVYSPICMAPCRVSMAPGAYRLALAKPGGRPVLASQPSIVREPSLIRGHYTDRSGLRAAGLAIGLAGTVGGIVMIVASAEGTETVCDAFGNCFDRARVNGPLLAGGIGVIVAAAIAGTVLAFQRDGVHLLVEPLRTAAGLGEMGMDRLASRAPIQGAALTLRF